MPLPYMGYYNHFICSIIIMALSKTVTTNKLCTTSNARILLAEDIFADPP